MIEFRIKEKTRSLNESFRGDWHARAAVAKRQRTKAMQACPKWPSGPLLMVRLTRLSPGTLDFANLAGALKHVQDGVAARLGVDDGSALVEWIFTQAPGEAEVVVQIWKSGEEAPLLPVGRLVAPMRQPRLKGSAVRLTTRRIAALKREEAAAKAAREADETFAPAPQAIPEPVARRIRMKMGLRKSLRQMETARDVSSESKETLSPGACPYLTCSGDCEHGKP